MSKIKTSILAVAISAAVLIAFNVMVSNGGGVGIDVQYAGVAGGCTEKNPILVTISNRLPFDLNSYSFSLTAKREGYSTDVRSELQPRGNDKIISSFGSDKLCWPTIQQDNLTAAYMAQNEYGSVAAAQTAITELQSKEDPTLVWSGKIISSNWDHGFRYFR